MTVMKVILIPVSLPNVVSKQKIKMNTSNTMTSPYTIQKLELLQKGQSYVSLVWVRKFIIVFPCFRKRNVFVVTQTNLILDSNNLTNLVDIQC